VVDAGGAVPVVELQEQVEGLVVGLLGVSEPPLLPRHTARQLVELSEFTLEVGSIGGAVGGQRLVEEVSSAELLLSLVKEFIDRGEDVEGGLGGG
jgi:hypothetical protein